MHLSHQEKQWVAVAGLMACLLGASAGYIAVQPALEAQFHGGVLDEDRAWVLWQNTRVAAVAFAMVASVAFAVLGLLPILLRRFLHRMRG